MIHKISGCRGLIAFSASFFFIFAFAATASRTEEDTGIIMNVLNNLDSLAVETEPELDYVTVVFPGDSCYYELGKDSDILNIVKTYYSDPSDQTEDVLGFLMNAYSEHDFYDTGAWIKNNPEFPKYTPYKGELPEFLLSDFCLPINGKLTSGYGYRPKRHRNHFGVDFAAAIGEPVKCALPGVITRIGFEKQGYGHYVVVTHSGDIETIYAHLSKINATPGARVAQGDIIGLSGSSGNSTGPHLHFEIHYRGKPVNPFLWFDIPSF